MADLEEKLAQYPKSTPKLIAFESVYSMCGSIAPIEAICDLAEKYGALTFLDEVHAVGMYGPHGAGVAEHLDFDAHLKSGIASPQTQTVMNRVDMVTGTLGKAYGTVGGYITGKANLIDWFRSLLQVLSSLPLYLHQLWLDQVLPFVTKDQPCKTVSLNKLIPDTSRTI